MLIKYHQKIYTSNPKNVYISVHYVTLKFVISRISKMTYCVLKAFIQCKISKKKFKFLINILKRLTEFI